ncbi:MAG: transglycosylase SLT domain-containing protein [Melioribacteraceae bacterium]|nr:transglycosylase SLT domain-containing protein [Melioribacteraceae bacterium]
MNSIDLKISNPNVHFKKGIDPISRFNPDEKKKLAKASKEFESMLTGMMIKSMTKTTDGLFGKDNYGGDVLDVLFETEISKFITESQGMGVADKIYTSLTGDKLSELKEFSKEKSLAPIIGNDKKRAAIKINQKEIKPNSNALDRIQKYDELIESASKKFNVDKQLIKSVILTESAGKVNAKSHANAKGLMQLMDSTATEMGVNNPWNPKENIYGGTKYLSKMLQQYDGDTDLALAAYNAGPGNVNKYKGIPPFKETQNYVKRVNNYLNILD